MLDLHAIASQILQAFWTSNHCVGSLLYTIILLQALRLPAHSCTVTVQRLHKTSFTMDCTGCNWYAVKICTCVAQFTGSPEGQGGRSRTAGSCQ